MSKPEVPEKMGTYIAHIPKPQEPEKNCVTCKHSAACGAMANSGLALCMNDMSLPKWEPVELKSILHPGSLEKVEVDIPDEAFTCGNCVWPCTFLSNFKIADCRLHNCCVSREDSACPDWQKKFSSD